MPISAVSGSASSTASTKLSSSGVKRRGQVGADHVERAMRQIDHVHDAEDERQTRRHQEQHHAELKPVQPLLDQQKHVHILHSAA